MSEEAITPPPVWNKIYALWQDLITNSFLYTFGEVKIIQSRASSVGFTQGEPLFFISSLSRNITPEHFKQYVAIAERHGALMSVTDGYVVFAVK
jgi:hypothetical protein